MLTLYKKKAYEIMKIVCMKNFFVFGIKLCACAFDDVFKDKFFKYFIIFFIYFKRKEIKTNISKKKIKKTDKINSHPLKMFETRKYDKKK